MKTLPVVRDVVSRVVLCDLALPGIGGLEVCEPVRTLQLPAQPTMASLTGRA